jgi:hypothetical protein
LFNNQEEQASMLINNTSMFGIVSELDDVFKINSNEAIWQLKPVNPSLNSNLGQTLIISIGLTNAAIEPSYLNSFETNDLRQMKWIGTYSDPFDTLYHPYKYKVRRSSTLSEYNMILRLSEQYLIRAEARAHQNNISGAREDLDIIRNRAGLTNTTADTKPSLLTAIEQERKVELFAEEGNHRWFDLKRMNRADEVLGATKAGWETTDVLYPIPEYELLTNPYLTQNPNY